MSQVNIIYGSTTGNTEKIAGLISEKMASLGIDNKLLDIKEASLEDFSEAKGLVLGTSTWGDGELQDDWEEFFSNLDKLDLKGMKVALFGLGDSDSYSEEFVSAMGILYKKVKERGADVVGAVSSDHYTFDGSQAVEDGVFIGLPLDEENEDDKHEERLDGWLESVKSSFTS